MIHPWVRRVRMATWSHQISKSERDADKSVDHAEQPPGLTIKGIELANHRQNKRSHLDTTGETFFTTKGENTQTSSPHCVRWKRAQSCGPTTCLCESKDVDGLLMLCAVSVDTVPPPQKKNHLKIIKHVTTTSPS